MSTRGKLPETARVGRGGLAAVLLLAGTLRAAACDIETMASLPLAREDGHLVTHVAVEGVDVRLLVDTGSAVTALDGAVADRLKLPGGGAGSAAVVGIGGADRHSFQTLPVGRMDLGALTLRGLTLMRADFNTGRPAAAGRIDGILGADILAHYEVESDPARGKLTLHRASHCTGAFVAWSDVPAVPLKPVGGGSLRSLAVQVDGHALEALLDMGATQSLLFAPAVRKLGRAAAPGRGDRAAFGIGASAGRRVDVRLHRFKALRVGPVSIIGPDLAVTRVSPMTFDMVLGLDVLGTRRTWLSYATNQLFMAPTDEGSAAVLSGAVPEPAR